MEQSIQFYDIQKQRNEVLQEITAQGYTDGQTFLHTDFLAAVNSIRVLTGKSPVRGQQILYLVDKIALLRPGFKKLKTKGERKVYEYTFNDLVDAVLSFDLSEAGYGFKEIKRILSQIQQEQGLDNIPQTRVIDVGGIGNLGLDDLARLLALMESRILQVAGMLGFQANFFADSLIAVRKLDNSELRNQRIGEIDTKEAATILHEANTDWVIGRANWRGEILVKLRDTAIYHNLGAMRFFQHNLPSRDKSTNYGYQIIFGVDPQTIDPREYLTIQSFQKGEFVLSEEHYCFLMGILHYLFDTLLPLDKRNKSVDSRDQLSIQPQFRGSMLSILTNLILEIPIDEKWDYCGIFRNYEKNLKAEVVSHNFPTKVKNVALFSEGHIMKLVYDTGVEEVLRDLEENDPRFPGEILQFDPLKAIAMIPTMGITRYFVPSMPQTVVLICARRDDTDDNDIFNSLNLALVRFIISMIGEIIGREGLQDEVIRQGVKLADYFPSQPASQKQLKTDISQNISDLLNENQYASHGLFFLTVRVDFEVDKHVPMVLDRGRLLSLSLDRVYRWVSSFISYHDKSLWQSISIYQMEENGLVIMVYPVQDHDDHYSLRTKLQKWLSKLENLKEEIHLIPDVWSLFFSITQLQNLLIASEGSTEAIESVAEFLFNQNRGSIQSLPDIRLGDKYLRMREFIQAEVHYEIAHQKDPENPYIIRHLVQCRIGQEDYLGAIEWVEEANHNEPENATTYGLWGDALRGKGDFEGAKDKYLKALTITPEDPEIHLHLAQTFVESITLPQNKDASKPYRIPTDIMREIKKRFSEAIQYTKPDRKGSFYTCQGKAFEQMGRNLEAIRAYENALKVDPDNEDYQENYRAIQRKIHSGSQTISTKDY